MTDAHGPQAHAVDPVRLEEFLRAHAERLGVAPTAATVVVEPLGGGHSNLTFLVRFGGRAWVLRRPPMGPLPPSAHDVVREARWLGALHPLFPLAPRPNLVCTDTSIIGAPFYLMEPREGEVVRHTEPAWLSGHPERRRAVGTAMVDALADLHALDASAPPLVGLGKPAGFLERQVRGWRQRWEAARTEAMPEMDDVGAWLSDHLPPDPARPTVLHGDYKLDNVMLAPENPGRLVAVFDWEMCALGDPLIDLAIMLAYWRGDIVQDATDSLAVVTDRPGWPTRDAIVARYGERHPVDAPRLAYCETFALFKIGVVIQQIVARAVRGHTHDPRFLALAPRVAGFARAAARAASAA